jgi:hypothetical protein
MSRVPFNRRDLLKLSVGGITGSGLVGRGGVGTIQTSEDGETFSISHPSDKYTPRGETATFEFSVEQVGEAPDSDDEAVTSIGGNVGFRDAWGDCEKDRTKWQCTAWEEYSIETVSTDDEINWTQNSPTTGSFGWSTPDDLQKGDTRRCSVTININGDATPGPHDLSVFTRTYPSGPLIQPALTPDEERFVTVTVLGPELKLTAEGDKTAPGNRAGDVIQPGGEATATFTITNTLDEAFADPDVLLSGIIDDPDWLVISGDPSAGEWRGDGWDLDELSSKQTETLEITVTPYDIADGEYELTGECTGGEEQIDTATATITLEETQLPEFEISAQTATESVALGETATIDLDITNTGNAAGDVSAYFQAATDATTHNADYYGEEFSVVAHDDDGGQWAYEGWSWTDIEPGETRTPSVELEVSESVTPDKYTFAIDAAAATATATLDVEEPAFELFSDAFEFQNWAGENTPGEAFDPSHNHEGLGQTWADEAADRWVDPLNEYSPVPIPKTAVSDFVDYLSENYADGAFTTGHCFGMVFTAADYYQNGIPGEVPAASVRDISQPTGEYSAVGADIDDVQSTQALDWDVIAQGNLNLSPPDIPLTSDPEIDFESEYELITERIDDNGVAPVGLGQSSATSGSRTGGSLHQVLAYEYQDTASGKQISVYDPNSPELIEFLTFSDGANWSMDEYDTGGTSYDRCGVIGSSRPDTAGMITGGFNAWGSIILGLISAVADGFVGVVANSPVAIEASDPNGESLAHPAEPIGGTAASKIAYAKGATPGEYEIRVEGTGAGDYSVKVAGQTPTGGRVNDSIAGTITEGETRTLAATIPESEDEAGGIAPSALPLGNYANEDGIIKTDGLLDAIADWRTDDIETPLLVDVIDAWRSDTPVS